MQVPVDRAGPPTSRELLLLALLSAGALAFELALTRVFAVQQFYHFAFVVVSLAVMGFAASGTLLSFQRRPISSLTLAWGFALSILVAYGIINYLPFDSFRIAWDGRQVLILILYFMAAALPFLLAGAAIGSALTAAGDRARIPYTANLLGSGIGCLIGLGALASFGEAGAVLAASALGWLAAAVISPGKLKGTAFSAAALACILLARNPPDPLQLRLSPYKPLSIIQLAPEASVTHTRWSASSRLDAVKSPGIHVFPGLGLAADLSLPPQDGLYLDGDGPLPVTHLSPTDPAAQDLAGRMPSDLPYRLRPSGTTLVLQHGAGLEVMLALARGSGEVWIPREEPLILGLLQGPYRNESQALLSHPALHLLPVSTRASLALKGTSYDILHFALSDPYRPVASGAFSLNEYYPLTVESLQAAYNRLNPSGYLMITRWLGTPPSETARTWATLLQALQREGVRNPEQRLIAFRGIRAGTMIAAREAFGPAELAAAREFFKENGFDPIYLPDIQPEELNRHNRLPEPVYHNLFVDLLERPDQSIQSYEFDIRPVTDDRPFFFHFFRWRQTPEVLQQFGRVWLPFGGSGYLVLISLLILVTLLAAALSTIPRLSQRGRGVGLREHRGDLIFFVLLGLGFLLVEIPLIQRFTLLLERPSISLAVVIFALLTASSLGSLVSERIPLRFVLPAAAATITAIAVVSPVLIRSALAWSMTWKVVLAALVIFPLGVLMGIPFAAGLRAVEIRATGFIPWAWAINGAFSGISGVLAAMISLDYGFTAALLSGAAAYTLSYWVNPERESARTTRAAGG